MGRREEKTAFTPSRIDPGSDPRGGGEKSANGHREVRLINLLQSSVYALPVFVDQEEEMKMTLGVCPSPSALRNDRNAVKEAAMMV